ncbi:MAG: hypothetical protein JSV09_16280 [Thermoplasmata archaeon]|nr:MAG: hypothetical protein JSV09_16280 [Thermoplasmata archaeon]
MSQWLVTTEKEYKVENISNLIWGERMFDPIHIKVKKWLEKTIESSESAVDHGWSVEVDEDNERLMTIDTPKMPFKIMVQVDDDLTYCAFITEINTKDMAANNIEPVFRSLLIQNKQMGLSKFCLLGDNDKICLRTDLYTNHMNKDEFNLALEAVILGGRWLIAELGHSEDEIRQAKEMSSLGAAELLKGTSQEEVVAKMVKAGYSEELAKTLVNKLAQELGLVTSSESQESMDKDKKEEDEKDNPVHKYIW